MGAAQEHTVRNTRGCSLAGAATQDFSWEAPEMALLMIQNIILSRLHARGYAPEGAKRRYPAHFISKLTDADAELQETLHWLLRAKAYGYLDTVSFDSLWESAKFVGRRLGSMMKSDDWS